MALLNNPRINLIAGCDTDSIALSKWQDANKKAVGYSDSANLYARCRPDIVTVAVNENAHLKEAVEAIHAKPKLVILEKPVALNLSEAEKIRQEAEKFQVPVLVNHERRFAEDFKLAKSYMKKSGLFKAFARNFAQVFVFIIQRKKKLEPTALSTMEHIWLTQFCFSLRTICLQR